MLIRGKTKGRVAWQRKGGREEEIEAGRQQGKRQVDAQLLGMRELEGEQGRALLE